MSTLELGVHVELLGETIEVGTAYLTRNRGSVSTTFSYLPSYLAHPKSYPIDTAFDLVTGSQHVDRLAGAFGDTAPDRWGRSLITKRDNESARLEGRRARTLDDVDFLLGVSDVTRQGALRFRRPASQTLNSPEFESAELTVPKLLTLPALLRAADEASAGGALAAIATLLDAGTGSLGGARPKAAVRLEDGSLALAKFPHREDQWDVMAWEATSHDLARRAGIRVPEHRLTTADDRHVLIVRRFDRDSTGHRLGYLSAMSVLQRRDGEQGDYTELAEALVDLTVTPTAQLHALFDRVVFSVAFRNTDDHLRNHGLLRTDRGWQLSPIFDVNPNPSAASGRQTSIAGATDPEDEPEGLAALAEYCRLDAAAARGRVLNITAATSAWREVACDNGVSRTEQSTFAETLDESIAGLRSAFD